MPSYVNLADIKPGMILAENLSNNFGQVLAKSGAEIKEAHLRMLKTWSIDGILIKEEKEDQSELSEVEKLKYMQKVASKFGFEPKTELEKDLMEACLLHFLKHNKVEINR